MIILVYSFFGMILVCILFRFFYSRWNFTTQWRSRARKADTNCRNGSRS